MDKHKITKSELDTLLVSKSVNIIGAASAS